MAEKKLRPGQKIKMVSVDELLGCAGEESSLEININRIQPFQNHPFQNHSYQNHLSWTHPSSY